MSTTETQIKILVVGCGPHATHFYLPAILRMAHDHPDITLAGVVDVAPRREAVETDLASFGRDIPAWFVEPFGGNALPEEAGALLDGLLARHAVNAVIVSTDPLHHRPYAEWALSRRVPLLMDKPVTTRENAALDVAQALGIEEDYETLLAQYLAQPEPRPPFVLCAHRRYHPGLLEARRIVREVCSRTGCPVTHIRAAHADGQWRLPHEICHQSHHSYNQGHGKLSHSGFHFIDCIAEFWRDGLAAAGKTADDVEAFASFIRPDGLARQMSRSDYHRFFGEDAYEAACPEDDGDLLRRYAACGEIDAECVLTLRREGVPFSTASLGLLHNSYSRRAWLAPDRDLYKGNGRVKHEDHSIQVGPFLNVRIQSYQSKDRHDVCLPGDDEQPGGNNHFELLVFRNERIIGGRPFERVALRDIDEARAFHTDTLFITQVKERSIAEWIRAIRRPGTPDAELLSAFSDHRMGVRLMAALYRSHAQRLASQTPLATTPWL